MTIITSSHQWGGEAALEVASYSSGKSAGSANSVTVTMPAGVSAGDLLLLTVFNQNSTNPGGVTDIVVPSGWTQIGYGGSIHTDTHSLTCWKIAGESESSVAVGNDDFPGNNYFYGFICLRITGHNPAAPINQSYFHIDGVHGAAHTAGPVTTTVDGCLILACLFDRENFGTPYSFASPYEKVAEETNSLASFQGRSGAYGATIQESAGPTGTTTITANRAGRGNSGMIAVAPAS